MQVWPKIELEDQRLVVAFVDKDKVHYMYVLA